jgi:hypothetical protein
LQLVCLDRIEAAASTPGVVVCKRAIASKHDVIGNLNEWAARGIDRNSKTAKRRLIA